MATNNFIVSSLPAYVQDNRDLLLKNFALIGTATRRRGITVQTGVKLNAYINYLDVEPTLQDGSTCGFSALGDVTLTQRQISTALIKVNMEICPDNLIGKYAEYLVRIGANSESLPFEQYIMDGVEASLNKKVEKLMWQGDTVGKSGDTDLKWIDGYIKLATDEGDVIDASIPSGASAYQGIMTVYASMAEEALERGAEIYVSPSIYRAFIMDLVSMNFYHYSGPVEAAPQEFYLPGTDVKVVSTPGLSGSLSILATYPRNLVYGTDMMSDTEDIAVWYSRDNETFRLKARWNSGVQFAFPEFVTLGTFSAQPAIVTGASLQSIADNVAALNDASKVFKTQAQG